MERIILVTTVGGTPEPVAYSLQHWKPARTFFLASAQTAALVGEQVLPALPEASRKQMAGTSQVIELNDVENIQSMVDQLLPLQNDLLAWKKEHPGARLIVDLTGGTKPMSSALTLCASLWGATISYVGGKQRDKEGVGIVTKGQEQLRDNVHPWDALQMIAVQQALGFLAKNEFGAAVELLRDTLLKVHRKDVKERLTALLSVAIALDHWDRFDIGGALRETRFALRQGDELAHVMGKTAAEKMAAALNTLVPHWEAIERGRGNNPWELYPTRALLADLLANAGRRMQAGRWDDAVARMYRTVEAAAQWHLHELGVWQAGKYITANVPLEARQKMPDVFNGSGKEFKLGVSSAWALIGHMDPQRAMAFHASGLGGKHAKLLKARNNSILAHGTRPIEEKDAKALYEAVERLVGEAGPLPRSPFQAP